MGVVARFLLQSLSHSSNGLWGLTEVVATRVGRLREWSQLRRASTVICKTGYSRKNTGN